MIDPGQVMAYSNADFAASNESFVARLVANHRDFEGTILDIGCGPGDVTLMLAAALPKAHVVGIDGSATMLAEAMRKKNNHLAGARVQFREIYLPSEELPAVGFDMIVSKDLLHHLPESNILWTEIARLRKPESPCYIMDLRRPESLKEAEKLVGKHAADAPKVLQEDFLNSLLAAFTPEELARQLEETPFDYRQELIGDRHMFVSLI